MLKVVQNTLILVLNLAALGNKIKSESHLEELFHRANIVDLPQKSVHIWYGVQQFEI